MKTAVPLVALVTLILSLPASAHAGKRLTTGSSGLTDSIECTVINVSETAPVTVNIRVRNAFGGLVTQIPALEIPPGSRGLLAANGTDMWCEFIALSGSTKNLRANMAMYDNGSLAGTEAARGK